MSSSAITVVPILNGTNYNEWASAMRAYLQINKLWFYVNGNKTCPENTYCSPTNAELQSETYPPGTRISTTTEAIKEKQSEWDELDDAAIGAILI